MRARTGRLLGGALTLLLLAVACARSGPPTAAPRASAAQPTPATAPPTAGRPSSTPSVSSGATARTGTVAARAPFDGLVDAAGVRMWLSCAGPGPLTLLVVPGLDATAASWSAVLPPLRRVVRTCVYDRPGLGHSPPRPDATAVVDAGGLAAELWAGLAAAGEHGPFLVLGHSFGGLVARAFVASHRSVVRGVLLLESVTPGDPTLPHFWTEAGHRVDLVASGLATHGGPPLGHLPLVVVSASEPDRDHLGGPPYGQPAWMTELWRRQQRDDLGLSTASVQVVAHAGHVVQQDDPPAVVMAVRLLLDAALRGGRPQCTGSWSAVGASCG
jgi:pimeloyl-ACP methyl ester carboxylesterase